MPITIEQVPCPQCGTVRPLQVRNDTDRAKVVLRICPRCNTANIRAYYHRILNDDPDEMAVERLMAGQPVKARPVERQAAVAYLTRRRLSAKQIAERIGCTQRTVERHRSRLAEAS